MHAIELRGFLTIEEVVTTVAAFYQPERFGEFVEALASHKDGAAELPRWLHLSLIRAHYDIRRAFFEELLSVWREDPYTKQMEPADPSALRRTRAAAAAVARKHEWEALALFFEAREPFEPAFAEAYEEYEQVMGFVQVGPLVLPPGRFYRGEDIARFLDGLSRKAEGRWPNLTDQQLQAVQRYCPSLEIDLLEKLTGPNDPSNDSGPCATAAQVRPQVRPPAKDRLIAETRRLLDTLGPLPLSELESHLKTRGFVFTKTRVSWAEPHTSATQFKSRATWRRWVDRHKKKLVDSGSEMQRDIGCDI